MSRVEVRSLAVVHAVGEKMGVDGAPNRISVPLVTGLSPRRGTARWSRRRDRSR
jgi:hypothetical protein